MKHFILFPPNFFTTLAFKFGIWGNQVSFGLWYFLEWVSPLRLIKIFLSLISLEKDQERIFIW